MSTRCLTPIVLRQHTDEQQDVACGKCPGCVKKRVSNWSFRLVKQGEVSTSALFITLTYDNEHVPITPNGFMTLEKTDLQKFFKRLRKQYTDGRKIKYYGCGEYGSRTSRPHYHIILFNADYAGVAAAWSLEGRMLGHVHYGEVTEASIGYTLKYISKQGKVGKHHRDDRQKEFALMSKRLGANYLTDAMIKWHKEDLLERMYCPMKDGKRAPMARYYKEKIYTKEELEQITQHLVIKARDEIAAEIQKVGEAEYVRLLNIKIADAFRKMYEKADKRDTI